MAKTRFISRCASYMVGVGGGKIVNIDNICGYETEDENEIAVIRSHSDFGNFVFEVQTEEALNKANAKAAAAILKTLAAKETLDEIPTPIPVAPLGEVDVEAEQQKLAQEQAEIKAAEDAERKAAEEAEAEKKAALEKKQASMQKAREAKAAKKTTKK